MEINVTTGDIVQQSADAIVVNLFEGVTSPAGATGAVDRALGGALSRLLAAGDFPGKLGTTLLLYTDGKLPAARVLVVGLGEAAKFGMQQARQAAAAAYRELAKIKGVKSYATIVHGAGIGALDPLAAAQALAEGTLLAAYQAPNYRREAPPAGPAQCTVVEFDSDKTTLVADGVRRGDRHRRGREPGPGPLQRAAERALPGGVRPPRAEARQRHRPARHRFGRGPDARPRHEHPAGRESRQRTRTPTGHPGTCARRHGERCAPRVRGQGDHLRHRRHQHQARRTHGGDETRHERRRSGGGRAGRNRPARHPETHHRRGRAGRKHARWERVPPRRHPDRYDGEDDGGPQHGRRGAPDPGRRAGLSWPSSRHAPWSTWRH